LSVELYSGHGQRLHAVDAEQGVYSLSDSGLLFTLTDDIA